MKAFHTPAPPALPPPTAKMPSERPPTSAVVAGLELFRCVPLSSSLRRPVCAERWVRARALRPTKVGLLNEHDGKKPVGADGPLAVCRGCAAGEIHALELGITSPTRRQGAFSPPGGRRSLPIVAPPATLPERPRVAAPPIPELIPEPIEPSEEEPPMSKKPATITHEGQTHTVAEWAKIKGLGESLIHYRMARGKPPAEILAPRSTSGRPSKGSPAPAPKASPAKRPRRVAATPGAFVPAAPAVARHPALELLECAGFVVHRSLEVPSGLMLVVGGK